MAEPTVPVREGMRVYSADGEYLGSVIAVGDTHFQIEKGLLVPHDYLADYSDVIGRQAGDLLLNRSLDELEELKPEKYGDVSPEPVNEPY